MNFLPGQNAQNEWRPSISFCIITNGKKPEHLRKELSSIRDLNISDYEIILAGSPPADFSADELKNVRVIQLPDAAAVGRLGEMRNACCDVATKEVFVVADDDLIFQSDFYQGLCQFGADFDLLSTRFLNTDGSRFWDWAEKTPTGQRLVDYSATTPNIYVTGGLSILKPNVYRAVKWHSGREFYQEEDVDFSARLKAAGFRISFNPYSSVVHNDERYSQVGDLVITGNHPFAWVEAASGVLVKGIYGRGGRRWALNHAKFAFQPVDNPIVINFLATQFSPGNGSFEPVTVSLLSGGRELGTFELPKLDSSVNLSLQLEPNSSDFEICCDKLDGKEAHGDFFGIFVTEFKVEGNGKNKPMPATNVNSRTLVLASILDRGELNMALRASFLNPSPSPPKDLAKNLALVLLKGNELVQNNLSDSERNALNFLAPKIEDFEQAIAFHDGSFPLGKNVYRPRDGLWKKAVLAAPASAIDQTIIEECKTGKLSIVTFSTEDYEALLRKGIPRHSVSTLPLYPQLHQRSHGSPFAPHIFISFAKTPKAFLPPLVEQLSIIVQQHSKSMFSICVDDESMEKQLLDEWSKYSSSGLTAGHLNVLTDPIPDWLFESLISETVLMLTLATEDPFGFLVRSSLARGVPVVGTWVGARKDICPGSGFVALKEVTKVASTLLEVLANYSDYRTECERFRNEVTDAPGPINGLFSVSNA